MTKLGKGLQSEAATWRQVRSKNDAELLLSPTRDFHDAFVRVAHLDSGSYVNNRFESIEEKLPSLWMLVQTQWKDVPAFELFFRDLERLEYIPSYERRGIVESSDKGCIVTLGGWKVSSSKLYFRFGTFEDLGPYPMVYNDREFPEPAEEAPAIS